MQERKGLADAEAIGNRKAQQEGNESTEGMMIVGEVERKRNTRIQRICYVGKRRWGLAMRPGTCLGTDPPMSYALRYYPKGQ